MGSEQQQLVFAAALNWLPDEIVFSLASRTHRIAGSRSSGSTCRLLFGHPKRGSAHDLPSGIDHLVEATRGTLGSASEIITRRTILPYFLPFQSEEVCASATSALRGDRIGGLKFQLGLLTSRLRANHPLKACPDCMASDIEDWSTPYWHRSHQLPGSWICHRHGCLLHEFTAKSFVRGRFGFSLPTKPLLRSILPHHQTIPTETVTSASALEAANRGLVGLAENFFFDQTIVRATLSNAIRLEDKEGHKRPLTRSTAADFIEHCRPLRIIPELAPLPDNIDDATRMLTALTRPKRTGTHPIKWMVAVTWLFDDFSAFMQAYTQQQLNLSTTPENPVKDDRTVATSVREKFVAALGTNSISDAARDAGISNHTARCWAAKVGVSTSSRPKVLKGRVRDESIRMLAMGADKARVAAHAGVSVQTISRLLLTEVGLQPLWKAAREISARASARRVWDDAVKAHGIYGVKSCIASAAASYAWLRRHDRDWLLKSVEAIKLPKKGKNNCQVDWVQRDEMLQKKIVEAQTKLKQAGIQRIRMAEIVDLVPEIETKLRKLSRLPKTRDALLELGIPRSTQNFPLNT